MTYLDKYPNCNGCPVIKYCGTMVGSTRLCHAYNEAAVEEEKRAHVLTLSKAAQGMSEEEYVESRIEMWDNITD